MQFRKLVGAIGLVMVALLANMPAAHATSSSGGCVLTRSQLQVLQDYGVAPSEFGSVVVDSNLTPDQAIGDNVVPPQYRELHRLMRPYLRVMTVGYRGYDDHVHLGQLVIHRDLVDDMQAKFRGMFRQGFPIQAVVPESQVGYDDEASMLRNHTSGYRPGPMINGHYDDHFKAIAVDINPFTNPFEVTDDNGVTTVDPPGAHHDPAAKGALYRTSPTRLLWHASGPNVGRSYGWAGNWGDPQADPEEFYKIGYFDWQHFYPADAWYDSIPLPAAIKVQL